MFIERKTRKCIHGIRTKLFRCKFIIHRIHGHFLLDRINRKRKYNFFSGKIRVIRVFIRERHIRIDHIAY